MRSPGIDELDTWDYFNGVKDHVEQEAFYVFKDNHVVSFKATVGTGTKNKPEMYTLWLMLKCAMGKDISDINITLF